MSEGLLFSMEGIEDLPRESGNLSETCHSGMISEIIFATEAAKQGFGVFFPVGHSHKADLVVWKPPARPVTVQVKKATWQKGDASPIFRDMPAPDMARRALERCGELEKEPFALDSLSRYVRQCREGFVPDEVKRYPFADEPGSEMYGLFRSSEDICAAGWFSEWEKILICKACHTSRPPQEKK